MKTTRRNCIKTGLAGAGFFTANLRGFAADTCCEPLPFTAGQRFPLNPSFSVPADELRMLSGYIHNCRVPDDAMDLNGGWRAVFDILAFSASPAYKKESGKALMSNELMGQVAITRPLNKTDYKIQMDFRPTRAVENVTALIRCNDDELFSIQDYELVWTCQSTPKTSYTRREAGRSGPGELQVVFESFRDTYKLSHPLSCLWTLLDAVRQLPGETGRTLTTDFFMDLTSMRHKQRLRFSGDGSVQTAGGFVPLRFFEQTGSGIEPIHYAVDERQRVLFATQGQLGWGLNRIEKI